MSPIIHAFIDNTCASLGCLGIVACDLRLHLVGLACLQDVAQVAGYGNLINYLHLFGVFDERLLYLRLHVCWTIFFVLWLQMVFLKRRNEFLPSSRLITRLADLQLLALLLLIRHQALDLHRGEGSSSDLRLQCRIEVNHVIFRLHHLHSIHQQIRCSSFFGQIQYSQLRLPWLRVREWLQIL